MPSASSTEGAWSSPFRRRVPWGMLAVAVVGFGGLVVASRFNYLLFHTLAELFSIIIAVGMFAFAWNSRRFPGNNYLVLLGVAYLFVAGLDLVHLLTYPGMQMLAAGGGNVSAQLWLAARYLEAASLLAAALMVGRRFLALPVFAFYTVLTGAALALIFHWPLFPVSFVAGRGMTPFKLFSEIAICAVLLVALLALRRRRGMLQPMVFNLLAGAMLLTYLSELCFTLYTDPYGLFNLTGHCFKIASFYALYKAVIETGLVRPYELLFRDLRASERVLRRERSFLDQVLQCMGAAVVIARADSGRIVLANARARGTLGVSPGQRVGAAPEPTGLFHADGRPYEAAQLPLRRALEKGETVENEQCQVRLSNGSFATLLASATPVRDSAGRVRAAVAVLRDVTERQRMQDALRQARQDLEKRVEERTAQTRSLNKALHREIQERTAAERKQRQMARQWQSSFDAITDPVLLLDREGRILRTNRAAEEFTGRSPPELKGSLCYTVMECPPDLRQRCPVRSMQRTHRRESFTRRLKDRWFHVTADPLKDEDGALIGVVHILRDITEQKAAARALQQSEQRLRLIAETIEDAFWLASPALEEFLYISPAFEKIWARSRETLYESPRSFLETIHPEDRRGLDLQVDRPRPEGWDLEYRILRPDGEARWVRDRGYPVYEEEGKLTMLVGVATDISERKEAEQDIRAYQARLRCMSNKLSLAEERERRRIASDLHDYIAQTLVLSKFSLGTARQVIDAEEALRHLDSAERHIDESIQYSRTLISDLSPPILYEVGLEAALQQLADRVEERHGRKVRFSGPGNCPEPGRDLRVLFFQSARELVLNAVKHAEADCIELGLERTDAALRLRVQDDGQGFDVDKAFNTHAQQSFGLFNIKERFQWHGGEFTISSGPERGTLAVLSVPLDQLDDRH